MERNDTRWHEAEVYRLKGELLAATRSRVGEAERWLMRAAETARHRRALWPELRARMALARRRDAAGGNEARGELLAVTERLTEGWDTADALEAAALLRSRDSDRPRHALNRATATVAGRAAAAGWYPRGMKSHTKSSITLPPEELKLVVELQARLKAKSKVEVVRRGLRLLDETTERARLREAYRRASLASRASLAKDLADLEGVTGDGLEER